MTGLHKGLTAAIDAMYDKEKLHVYGCTTLLDAIQYVRAEDKHASEAETISLLYCAWGIAENDHGPSSLEYAMVQYYVASFESRHGNLSSAFELLQQAYATYKKLLPTEHPQIQKCKDAMKIAQSKIEAQNAREG